MNDVIRNYLIENIDIIDRCDFDTLFKKCFKFHRSSVLEELLQVGINPLEYMHTVYPRMFLTSDEKQLIFPEGVCHIQSQMNNYRVEKIVLPSTLYMLGHRAFRNNSRLSEINFPEGMRIISDEALLGTRLTHVHIPSSVTEIGSRCFCNILTLEEVIIDCDEIILRADTFQYCISLKRVVLPKGVQYIEDECFDGCSSLIEVEYRGTKQDFIDRGLVDNKEWRRYSSIEKVLCSDGEIKFETFE